MLYNRVVILYQVHYWGSFSLVLRATTLYHRCKGIVLFVILQSFLEYFTFACRHPVGKSGESGR